MDEMVYAEECRELVNAQLLEFQRFLPRFIKKDEKIERIYELGETPSNKDAKEFAKLKIEYLCFEEWFKKHDGVYWEGELSTMDFVQLIKEQAGLIC